MKFDSGMKFNRISVTTHCDESQIWLGGFLLLEVRESSQVGSALAHQVRGVSAARN
jgi:hypothetical protein